MQVFSRAGGCNGDIVHLIYGAPAENQVHCAPQEHAHTASKQALCARRRNSLRMFKRPLFWGWRRFVVHRAPRDDLN